MNLIQRLRARLFDSPGTKAPSSVCDLTWVDWSAIEWRFVTVVPEGRAFEIVPGVNVWDYDWIQLVAREDGRQVEIDVVDPAYGQHRKLQLWSIANAPVPVFAAGEFSNFMYAFYLPENLPGAPRRVG
jgi:hypothetical protein